jgi:hypothetical protein
VTFAPTTEGDFTSDISITDNAHGSPQTVALSGTGVAQPPPCIPQGGFALVPVDPIVALPLAAIIPSAATQLDGGHAIES